MAAPERFADTPDSFPLHRGRRPYMAHRAVPAMHRIRTISASYGQLLLLLRFTVVRGTRGLLRGADQAVIAVARIEP